MAGTPKDFFELAKKVGAECVDLKFVDMLGTWQHCSYPLDTWDEKTFTEGVGFDGSSIRGWQAINESDMLLVPVPDTAVVDPFAQIPTLVMICMVQDPITREDYSRDPRNIARKAVNYLKSTGIADTCFIGPEAEFFVFDDVRFDQNAHEGYFHLDSVEAEWNRGRADGPNLGYTLRHKEGYAPCPPSDQLMDIRNEMMLTMIQCGIDVEAQHHEVATAGQCEIDMRFQELVRMADQVCLYKYIVRNVARRHGKTATFMPKPVVGDNGSGMHCHQSVWKDGQNLFAGNGYAGLSEFALYYIGGIIKHARALNAITNPGTNSYKRLVPGFEAPVKLAYSSRNRSASIRIPHVSSPKARRIEVRFPDPTANPYMAFAAMMMAGLDGVMNKIHPGEPSDKNLYDLPPEEDKKIPTVCSSLDQALEALDKDREFLTRGGVFSNDMIDSYIALKMEEVTRFRMTTHPVEFDMYYSL